MTTPPALSATAIESDRLVLRKARRTLIVREQNTDRERIAAIFTPARLRDSQHHDSWVK